MPGQLFKRTNSSLTLCTEKYKCGLFAGSGFLLNRTLKALSSKSKANQYFELQRIKVKDTASLQKVLCVSSATFLMPKGKVLPQY